jgi:hypothetical protein
MSVDMAVKVLDESINQVYSTLQRKYPLKAIPKALEAL